MPFPLSVIVHVVESEPVNVTVSPAIDASWGDITFTVILALEDTYKLDYTTEAVIWYMLNMESLELNKEDTCVCVKGELYIVNSPNSPVANQSPPFHEAPILKAFPLLTDEPVGVVVPIREPFIYVLILVPSQLTCIFAQEFTSRLMGVPRIYWFTGS